MSSFDPRLLDGLAQCYADAVVRRLLEGPDHPSGKRALPASNQEMTDQEAPGTPTGSQMSSEEESAEILACCFCLLQPGEQT